MGGASPKRLVSGRNKGKLRSNANYLAIEEAKKKGVGARNAMWEVGGLPPSPPVPSPSSAS